MGEHAGDDFLNAVALLETELQPLELLDVLQSVEDGLHRVRDLHWGPRTIDLDIILNESNVITHPRLSVPHPHCWYRRFVVDPLVEIAPDTVHPIHERTFAQLQTALLQRPFTIAITGLPQADKPVGPLAILEDACLQLAGVEIVDSADAAIVIDFSQDETSAERQRANNVVDGDPANPLQSIIDVVNSVMLEPAC